jgi:hypothetical protein
MTQEELEKRLQDLRKLFEQMTANGNAVAGAIQECEYWLAKIKAKPVEEAE